MNDLAKKIHYAYSFLRKRFVHVNLQILYQCNFHCQICDFWKPPYKDMPQLSLAQTEIFSKKLYALGPLIVSIGGGEPLLHPDLVPIIRSLAKYHLPVMICNGWFVTPENARAMFKAGLYEVSVSLDYASPQKHDQQRGVAGAFDHAVSALEHLLKNRAYAHQRVHMISVVMDDNLAEIEPLIRLAKDIGVTYLLTLYSHGRGKKKPRASEKDISELLFSLKKKYKNFVALHGYLARFTEAVQNENGILPCYAGRNLLNIDCNGNVSRCIDRLDQPAGNILSDGLEQIIRELRNQYLENDCGGCWTSCRGNIESLMYGKNRLQNLWDSFQVTKRIALNG
jgi:MoaA/NifB/PqqE/SkfB family radical SAM enzyme